MILAAPRLFLDGGFAPPGAVEIEAGRITAVHHHVPAGRDIVELDRGILAPGLIDLHNNGAFGSDCAAAEPADLTYLTQRLAAHGVTAFLPTIITAPIADLHAAAARIAAATPAADGASIFGLHLEGPFLSHARRGAHREDWLRDPTEANLGILLEHEPLRRILRLITLAPERPGALEAIAELRKRGIIISLGHSDADAEISLRAIAAGASIVTHVFNAMAPLHHRAPALAGVALSDPRISACFIADGLHLDPLVLRLGFAAAGARAIAVTDSISLAGLAEGATEPFGGAPAVLRDGAARREDGSLCGAAITLDQGIARLIEAGIAPESALFAATAAPADALGLNDRGRIALGRRADLVWLDDDFSPLETWIAGNPIRGTAPASGRRARSLPPTETARPELADLDLRPSDAIITALLDQESRAQISLRHAVPQLAELADAMARTIESGGRIFTLGAGTSGRLAILDAVECGPTFSLPPGIIIPLIAGGVSALAGAVEGAEDHGDRAIAALDQHRVNADDLVIGIAASGNTEFVRSGLAHARAVGATTAAISNNPAGAILEAVDHPIILDTGAEILAGSTRLSAGTAQKIALNALSTTAMIRLGKTFGAYMVDLRATNAKLRRRAVRIVRAVTGCDESTAESALTDANYAVKTAITMIRYDIDAATADRRLNEAAGRLRRRTD